MPKPMTPSEALVGRRIPPMPTYTDTLLAGHLREPKDGETPNAGPWVTCARSEPADSWLRAPHKSLRKKGFLKRNMTLSFGQGKPFGIWQLTETGIDAALKAKAKVIAREQERKAWSQDFLNARKQQTPSQNP